MEWRVQMSLRIGSFGLDVALRGGSEAVAVVGPNGAGKTTLLRTIAGAISPKAGVIQLGERTLFDAVQGINVPPEKRRIGYVPQGLGLFPHLSVEDNVAFGLLGCESREARREQARALLRELDCEELALRKPLGLSGGERQRVALARALLPAPALLLLDEPLSALDVAARRQMRSSISQHLRERDCPVIVVTHDLRDVMSMCERVFVVEGGRIVQEGTVDALRRDPATPFVQEFFFSDMPGFREVDHGY